MRRFHIYIGFIVWLLTSLFAVSCNDELEGNGYTLNSSSNLHVLVPTVLSESGEAFTSSSSEAPTYNATVDECQINDLRLYAFPVNNVGKLIAENLPAPLASMMLEPNVANYQLTIEPGTYHIYVVANMSDVLKDKNITTEGELKKLVLGYTSNLTPGLPISTNIPMIYEPKDINGNLLTTNIDVAGDKYTTVAANLKFTCVKVKLNLLFDPTAEGSAFKGKSYRIKDILAQKLSPSTTLSWNGAFSNSNVNTDYAKGFENEVYATVVETLQQLQLQGYRLFLATAKPTVYAKRILAHFGLDQFFTEMYGSELTGERTNKVDLIAYILEKEQLDAQQCIMVGDRQYDVIGARANSIETIAVNYGYGTAEELAQVQPIAQIAQFSQLLNTVNQLNLERKVS